MGTHRHAEGALSAIVGLGTSDLSRKPIGAARVDR
jgi:hypothetical protein